MIAIINYKSGNIKSVKDAFSRLGLNAKLTNNPEEILGADKVIFPGVGEASFAMEQLKATGLHTLIPTLTQPVLGICLGMQLLCAYSEEGQTDGLGIFDLNVTRFPKDRKVPHMGWNNFESFEGPLFKNVQLSNDVYFVHSFYVPIGEETIAQTQYIQNFSAALNKNNFYAVQFHPEKSGKVGQQILQNFLAL